MALTKITSSLVAINSLTAANIADNAVDATKIASNSILTRHIDDDQVTGDQLADNLTIAGTLTSTGAITGTLATAAQTNITSLGTLTTLTVDDITINASTISDGGALTLSSGDDLTLDAVGDIHLDADGADITFKDAGTIKMLLKDGKLGIGDASPRSALHVVGNITINASSNAPYIDFVEHGATDDPKARIAMDQISGTDGQLLFYTEDGGTLAEKMRLTDTGKVQIGSPTTDGMLAVKGTGAYIDLDSATNNNAGVRLYENGTFKWQLYNDGDASDAFKMDDGTGTVMHLAANNLSIGLQALNSVSGARNLAVGRESGYTVGNANDNTYLGYQAGRLHTGGNTICIGSNAGDKITSADQCVIIGMNAAFTGVMTGDDNTIVGCTAGTDMTSGEGNVSVGRHAHAQLTTGSYNVAIGSKSGGYSDTGGVTGVENVTIGKNSGYDLSSGDANVCIGSETGFKLNNDSGNVHIGQHAGRYRNGGPNTFVGYWAGRGTESNGSIGNTGIGNNALTAIVGGTNNAVLGHNAGAAITSGATNTCIGYAAGDTIQSGGDNIIIGGTADCAHDSSNAIVLGPLTGQGDYFKFGKGSNIVSNQFTSDAAWARSSDERLKQDIKEDTLGLSFINDLNTVTYRWKPSNEIPQDFKDYNEENQKDTEVVMHGMLAQEVKAALDTAGVETFSGWTVEEDGMQNISREMFVIPLIKAIQELSAEVEQLKQQAHEKCDK